jgi:membrane associated rhomboid family serine protease
VSAGYLFLNMAVVSQGNKTDIWGHIGGLIGGITTTLALSFLENSPERTIGAHKRR